MVKLKINTNAAHAATAAAAPYQKHKPSSSSKSKSKPPPPPTPGTPKITLKTGNGNKPTTLKLKSSSFSAPSGPPPTNAPPPLRTPILKLKTPKAPAPRKRHHQPGNGYDSEASDREDDPAIEEQFILRMPPGEDCDYLRGVIERKELSVTSDVWFKFKDSRHAVVCVRGHLYGALLVDLPCIIEANKTLDKKAIFKAADISQMLLVGDRITHEEQVRGIPSRPQDTTYAHGITPPMQYVRKRRFRKRISNRTIEAVETEVDRLLREDDRAESSKFSLVDANELVREGTVSENGDAGYDLLGEDEYDDEQDAEGEMEYEFEGGIPEGDVEIDEDTLANDLESALMAGEFEGMDTENRVVVDVQPQGAATPGMTNGRAGAPDTPAGEDEESDEDEDEEEEAEELDEAAQEAAQEREKLREEVEDLDVAIKTKVREYEGISNQTLKQRILKIVQGLKAEYELKVGQLNQMGG